MLDGPPPILVRPSQGHLIDFLLQWAKDDKCLIFSTQDLDIVGEEIATRVIVMSKEHGVITYPHTEGFSFSNLVHEHSHRHKQLIAPVTNISMNVIIDPI